jgi:hypothetical protein
MPSQGTEPPYSASPCHQEVPREKGFFLGQTCAVNAPSTAPRAAPPHRVPWRTRGQRICKSLPPHPPVVGQGRRHRCQFAPWLSGCSPSGGPEAPRPKLSQACQSGTAQAAVKPQPQETTLPLSSPLSQCSTGHRDETPRAC